MLLRRALLLPHRPAVIVINGFRWSGVKEADRGACVCAHIWLHMTPAAAVSLQLLPRPCNTLCIATSDAWRVSMPGLYTALHVAVLQRHGCVCVAAPLKLYYPLCLTAWPGLNPL